MLSKLRTGFCLFLVRPLYDPTLVRERCVPCGQLMTLRHLLVDCPALSVQRVPIVGYLRCKNLPPTEATILGDEFPHALLFNFLRQTGFASKI